MSQDKQQDPTIFQLENYQDLTGSDIDNIQLTTKPQTKTSIKSHARKKLNPVIPTPPTQTTPQVKPRRIVRLRGCAFWFLIVFFTFIGVKQYVKWRQEIEFSAFTEGKSIIDIGFYAEQIKGFPFGNNFAYYNMQTKIILIEPTGVNTVHYFIKPGTFVSASHSKNRKKIKIDSLTQVTFVKHSDISNSIRTKWNKSVLVQNLTGGEKWRTNLSNIYVIEFSDINIMPYSIDDFNENNVLVLTLPKYCLDKYSIDGNLNLNDIPLKKIRDYVKENSN
jgi:hypothetical protein